MCLSRQEQKSLSVKILIIKKNYKELKSNKKQMNTIKKKFKLGNKKKLN